MRFPGGYYNANLIELSTQAEDGFQWAGRKYGKDEVVFEIKEEDDQGEIGFAFRTEPYVVYKKFTT